MKQGEYLNKPFNENGCLNETDLGILREKLKLISEPPLKELLKNIEPEQLIIFRDMADRILREAEEQRREKKGKILNNPTE